MTWSKSLVRKRRSLANMGSRRVVLTWWIMISFSRKVPQASSTTYKIICIKINCYQQVSLYIRIYTLAPCLMYGTVLELLVHVPPIPAAASGVGSKGALCAFFTGGSWLPGRGMGDDTGRGRFNPTELWITKETWPHYLQTTHYTGPWVHFQLLNLVGLQHICTTVILVESKPTTGKSPLKTWIGLVIILILSRVYIYSWQYAYLTICISET